MVGAIGESSAKAEEFRIAKPHFQSAKAEDGVFSLKFKKTAKGGQVHGCSSS